MDMIRVFKGNDVSFTSNGDKIIKPIDAVIRKDTEEEYLELEAPLSYIDYLIQDNILVVDTLTGKKAYRMHNPETGKTVLVKAMLIWQENNPSPSDRGVVISHGKNLKDCKVSENWDDVVTKIIPIGYEGARLPEGYIEITSPHQRVYERTIEFDFMSEEELEEIEEEIEAAEQNIATLQTTIDVMQGKLCSNSLAVSNLTNDISALEAKIASLGETEPELKEKAILEAQIDVMHAEVDILVADQIDYALALIGAENSLPTAQSTLVTKQTDRTNLIIGDLRTQANNYLNDNLYPKMTYDLDAHLEGVLEVGDSINVKHERMKIDILAYVTGYTWDCLTGKYSNVQFGTDRLSLLKKFSGIENNITRVSGEVKTVNQTVNELSGEYVVKLDGNGKLGLFRLGQDENGTEIFIKADNIRLEGLITANGFFKILEDGSIEAVRGKFTGEITGSTIKGSNIYAKDCIYLESGYFYYAENKLALDGITGDYPDYNVVWPKPYGEMEIWRALTNMIVLGDGTFSKINGKCWCNDTFWVERLFVDGNARVYNLYAVNGIEASELIENGVTLSDKYAPKTHTHNYASSGHGHSISDISELESRLINIESRLSALE